VFSDDPTVTHLDPALRAALRKAATAAADARGIQFVVNSGWRPPRTRPRCSTTP